MAKYQRSMRGSFDDVLGIVNDVVMRSMSASLEGSSEARIGNVRVAVRVYERYSWIGSNRVSLSLTLVGEGDQLFVSAITSGGSQAVLFKINTLGEENFLSPLSVALENYVSGGGRR